MSEHSAVKSHVNPTTALACGVRGMGGARFCATDSPSRAESWLKRRDGIPRLLSRGRDACFSTGLTGFTQC